MSSQPHASPRQRTAHRRAIALMVIAACALPGSAARAQGRGPDDARTLAGYRLTMPIVRKVLGAMREADTDPEMRQIKQRWAASGARPDYTTMSLAQLAAQYDAMPPAKRALARAGVSSREAATVYTALMRAISYTSQEDAANARAIGARPPAPLPPGAAASNVALVRQNQAELERLGRAGGP